MLKIDGSYGEGGGQILRTSLTLACITGQAIEIENIRAGRKQPGLRPQHLTSVHAAAEICEAEISGAQVGSDKLTFKPGRTTKSGAYHWDIGTAGAATLVLQTVLLPLTLAQGASRVIVEGGTHVPYSPPAHYLRDVYVPMLIQSGGEVYTSLERFGWYPQGGGRITAEVEGWAQLQAQDLSVRGELERIFGVGLVTNLPAHIPQRMSDHANKLLSDLAVPMDIRPQRDSSTRSTGAGFFLTAEYANGRAGFSALGERGMPSEQVTEESVLALLSFDATVATVDEYLADQLLLILALADGESRFVTPVVTEHLRTNAWVIQKITGRETRIETHTGRVTVV
jgi:RNA 3'-terminal phosphate cyclase (ATP)